MPIVPKLIIKLNYIPWRRNFTYDFDFWIVDIFWQYLYVRKTFTSIVAMHYILYIEIGNIFLLVQYVYKYKIQCKIKIFYINNIYYFFPALHVQSDTRKCGYSIILDYHRQISSIQKKKGAKVESLWMWIFFCKWICIVPT